MGVLSQQNGRPALTADQTPGIFARIAAMQNPGYMVAQGINKITNPGYPVDDALRGWANNAPAFQPTLGGVGRSLANNGLNQTSEFLTALQRGDIDAVMNSSLFPMGGMTVFHGSPHKFDAFDMSKIGTGEGAQAYGHGLYFAENPKVAKEYSKLNAAGSVTPNRTFLGAELSPGSPEYHAATLLERSGTTLAQVRKEVSNWISEGHPDAKVLDGWKRALETLNKASKKSDFGVTKGGSLYHVDIPDEHIAKMLDWDKPLSEQAPEVQKALSGIDVPKIADGMEAVGGGKLRIEQDPDFGPRYFLEIGDKKFRLNADDAERLSGEGKGQSLYRALKEKFGGGKQGEVDASEYLKSKGIPGIRYFDSGSRSAGEGTRNIVLFDENLAKIIKRE